MAEGRAPARPARAKSKVSFEDFVTGRLTLVTLRNQLDTEVAGLRSQLAVAESQLRQTEELLRRANEKMAIQHPEAFAQLTGSEVKAPRRSRA
jgi:hypothetical protein